MRAYLPRFRTHAGEVRDLQRTRKWLLGILLFNGIGAVFGGIGLLTDSLGAPATLLAGTPFTDYTIPGWVLLIAVGGTSLGAAFALWKHVRQAALASILAGLVLLGWIIVEFVMIPEGWAPQLLYFMIAVLIIRMGLLMHKASLRGS